MEIPFVDDFANNAYKIRLLFCFRLVERGKVIIFNHSDSMKECFHVSIRRYVTIVCNTYELKLCLLWDMTLFNTINARPGFCSCQTETNSINSHCTD